MPTPLQCPATMPVLSWCDGPAPPYARTTSKLGLALPCNAEVKTRYLQIMCQLTNGPMAADEILKVWNQTYETLKDIVPLEKATTWKGIDPLAAPPANVIETFGSEYQRIKTWIPERIKFVQAEIAKNGRRLLRRLYERRPPTPARTWAAPACGAARTASGPPVSRFRAAPHRRPRMAARATPGGADAGAAGGNSGGSGSGGQSGQGGQSGSAGSGGNAGAGSSGQSGSGSSSGGSGGSSTSGPRGSGGSGAGPAPAASSSGGGCRFGAGGPGRRRIRARQRCSCSPWWPYSAAPGSDVSEVETGRAKLRSPLLSSGPLAPSAGERARVRGLDFTF